MRETRIQYAKGLTLIEVMIALLASVVIVAGAMLYFYSCALNARMADVRVTATRLGQLLLDSWKTTGPVVDGVWDVGAFDPTDADFDLILPDDIGATSEGIAGVGTELGNTRYEVMIDGAHYFITLSYQQNYPSFYLLNACVAWNRNFGSPTLGGDPEWVWLTSYSIY